MTLTALTTKEAPQGQPSRRGEVINRSDRKGNDRMSIAQEYDIVTDGKWHRGPVSGAVSFGGGTYRFHQEWVDTKDGVHLWYQVESYVDGAEVVVERPHDGAAWQVAIDRLDGHMFIADQVRSLTVAMCAACQLADDLNRIEQLLEVPC